ncbi:hypothetical protein [Hyphomicrobium sp.]|uniref:hypothetical protein n=1 Tax=Hyphomicrobium sp. TaxID=82 RepID=UPI002FDFFC6B
MKLEFDPVRKRAIDLDSGLAVQWVRDEPPMERQTHFKIICAGTSIPFAASYDHGDKKISDDRSLTPGERFMRRSALKESNYYAQNIGGVFDRAVFVCVWRHLVSQGLTGFRVSTYYTEFHGSAVHNAKTWSCEG